MAPLGLFSEKDGDRGSLRPTRRAGCRVQPNAMSTLRRQHTQRVNIDTDLHIFAIMGVRSMRLAFFALVAILVCSVYAQSTEKSAAKIDVGSLSTQEIEEELQVRPT